MQIRLLVQCTIQNHFLVGIYKTRWCETMDKGLHVGVINYYTLSTGKITRLNNIH